MTPPDDPTVRMADFNPTELTLAVRGLERPLLRPASVLNHLRAVSQMLRQLPTQPQEPSLVYADSTGGIRAHPIGQTLKVGRQVSKGLGLPMEKTLSRQHFEVAREGEDFVLRNLSKSNGTTIAGVEEPVNERVLRDGDLIEAGRLNFIFVIGPVD